MLVSSLAERTNRFLHYSRGIAGTVLEHLHVGEEYLLGGLRSWESSGRVLVRLERFQLPAFAEGFVQSKEPWLQGVPDSSLAWFCRPNSTYE